MYLLQLQFIVLQIVGHGGINYQMNCKNYIIMEISMRDKRRKKANLINENILLDVLLMFDDDAELLNVPEQPWIYMWRI